MTDSALRVRAFDALYTVSPAQFTGARKKLAAQAKTEGDAEAAKAITAAKKPTQAAYLLNQLARQENEQVVALVDLGRTLERAQRAALRTGDATELRAAIATQRQTITALTAKAAGLARSLGVQVAMHAVTGALQAAVTDAAVGAELEAGTLHAAPEVRGGFGDGFALETATPRPESAPPKAKAAKGMVAAAKSAAATRREAALQATAARKQAAAVARATAEAARLELAATAAEEHAARLEAAAKDAFDAAERARAGATRLRTQALQAKRAARAG